MKIGQRAVYGTGSSPSRATEIVRIGVGLVWLAGAVWNLTVTLRMDDPFGWLAEGSWFAPWRWFFGDVVEAHPPFWIALLVVAEAALGALTLGRGNRARLGLAGGALFSAVLFSFGTTYTLIMGPYALLLGWLARHEYGRTFIAHLPSPRRVTGKAA
jgi:hypothetical protein